MAFTIGGPRVMFGTKRPSITSTWIQSAPAASTARTSCASLPKSEARMEGATRTDFSEAATSRLVTEEQPSVKLSPGRQSCCRAYRKGRLLPLRPMNVRRIEKSDFDRIVEVIDHWWGGPISTFAHPIFFYELGGAALVVEEGSLMIGFLLGFVVAGASAGRPTSTPADGRCGYVHLVG